MRVPKYIFPILLAFALIGGYFLRTAFTQPTTFVAYDKKAGDTSVFIVDGLKCKGTATYFTSLYDSIPGIIGIETFASENKALITYDPEMITRDSIRAVMEAEVEFNDGTKGAVFKCRSID